ncbi:MAG: hypothetical protein WC539_08995 [Nitrospirota bacterium]
MGSDDETRKKQALEASGDAIIGFLHDPSPIVMRALIGNKNLSEDEIIVIAARKNLPQDVLTTIARDERWADRYPVHLALARNPKTPLSVSLSRAQQLRFFDLVDLSRNRFLPTAFRRKIEFMIIEKIPMLPLGVRKTLAKRASGDVLLTLMRDGHPEVAALCLDNPYLLETHLFAVINRKDTPSSTLTLIARHRNWSSRSLIKRALVRNEQLPLELSVPFLKELMSTDIRELYEDPLINPTIKPFLYREMTARAKKAERTEKKSAYQINDEDAILDDTMLNEKERDENKS